MKAILTTIFVCAALAVCVAQQEPPRPAELDKLDFLTGEFTQIDTVTGPTGEKTEVKDNKSSVKWSLGKRYIHAEYFGDMPGMGKFEGLMMISWNELISKYEGTWFDSTGGWHIKASGTFENDTLVLTSEAEEMPGAGKMFFRMSYKKLDAKKIEFKLDMKMADADWSNMMTSIMTRKG
jgi:hypothetical protein